MTPAELKSIREAMNLPGPWFADRLGISITRLYLLESPGRTIDIPEPYEPIVQALQADYTRAFTRLADRADYPLPRYESEGTMHAEIPELAGWPTQAQGPLLTAVRAQTGAPIRFVA